MENSKARQGHMLRVVFCDGKKREMRTVTRWGVHASSKHQFWDTTHFCHTGIYTLVTRQDSSKRNRWSFFFLYWFIFVWQQNYIKQIQCVWMLCRLSQMFSSAPCPEIMIFNFWWNVQDLGDPVVFKDEFWEKWS